MILRYKTFILVMEIKLFNKLISIGYDYTLNSLINNHFLFNMTLFSCVFS